MHPNQSGYSWSRIIIFRWLMNVMINIQFFCCVDDSRSFTAVSEWYSNVPFKEGTLSTVQSNNHRFDISCVHLPFHLAMNRLVANDQVSWFSSCASSFLSRNLLGLTHRLMKPKPKLSNLFFKYVQNVINNSFKTNFMFFHMKCILI